MSLIIKNIIIIMVIIIIIIIIITIIIIIIICPLRGKRKRKVGKVSGFKNESCSVIASKCYCVIVTHVVVGALGMVTKNLQRSLQEIGVSPRTEFLQNVALLGTARILRKVLEA